MAHGTLKSQGKRVSNQLFQLFLQLLLFRSSNLVISRIAPFDLALRCALDPSAPIASPAEFRRAPSGLKPGSLTG